MPKSHLHKKNGKKKFTYKKEIIYLCSCCAAVLLIFLASFNLDSFFRPVKVLGSQTENQEVVFWQDFLAAHPNYFPGWVALTELNILTKDKPAAISTLAEAKKINPNSESLKILEMKINAL